MASYALQGRVALVTGAMRGIGLETAKALRARGASVTVTDVDADGVEQAAAEIGGDNVLGLLADVRDQAAMNRSVQATVERFGGVDVVVANAGISSPPR